MTRSLRNTLIAVLAALIATAALAAAAKDAPENVSLDACKAKKPAVAFTHKAHVDRKIDCATCHHTQKDLKAGAATEVKKCSSCHLKPEKPETLACTEMSTKKNNFHKQCIGCHKDDKKKNKDSKAPKSCKDCHKK